VLEIPIPIDCVDGFTDAYQPRPERFLDPAVRRSQSAWSLVDPAVADTGVARLAADLASGNGTAGTGTCAPSGSSSA
jgi:hypothetical protein